MEVLFIDPPLYICEVTQRTQLVEKGLNFHRTYGLTVTNKVTAEKGHEIYIGHIEGLSASIQVGGITFKRGTDDREILRTVAEVIRAGLQHDCARETVDEFVIAITYLARKHVQEHDRILTRAFAHSWDSVKTTP